MSLHSGEEKDEPSPALSQDLWVSVESEEQKTRSVPLLLRRGLIAEKDSTRLVQS